ncbi:hypothetical protein V8F20_006121 [Naviculisporaceae sp. PSN 640]
MLEYFAYKKFKKNKAEKAAAASAAATPTAENAPSSPAPAGPSRTPSTVATATPLLTADDERFLERLTSHPTSAHDEDVEEGPRPALPPRIKTPDLTWDSDSESFVKGASSKDKDKTTVGTAKDKAKAGINRVSLFLKSKAPNNNNNKQLAVPSSSGKEVTREEDDLTRVLEDLNLAARNNKAFALSADSNELVRKFTLVLKDLVNGVPTAVNDLTSLLDDRDGVLSKNYEKLPSSLKKLVTQLPDKLSESIAPELLATAAAAQGISADEAAKSGGIKGAAKRMLIPKNLKDLVTKPGAVVSMLKGIMNALKLRWPAFMGTNVIWSLALFLLLFVLWYCHKRGREVRLDKEAKEKEGDVVDGRDRVEELPDDPALPAPESRTGRSTGATTVPVVVEPEGVRARGGDGSRTE